EAGGPDSWIWFHIPVGYLFAIGNPRSDWMYKTEPEPGLNGRVLNYPRGKVVGGSSAINAMIYMRGQARDYDHWRQLGLNGWGWDDVLPYFKKHEHHFMGDSAAHATGGEWRGRGARGRRGRLGTVCRGGGPRGGRALAPGGRDSARALPRRGDPRGRLGRLDADHAAVGRRSGRAAAGA